MNNDHHEISYVNRKGCNQLSKVIRVGAYTRKGRRVK